MHSERAKLSTMCSMLFDKIKLDGSAFGYGNKQTQQQHSAILSNYFILSFVILFRITTMGIIQIFRKLGLFYPAEGSQVIPKSLKKVLSLHCFFYHMDAQKVADVVYALAAVIQHIIGCDALLACLAK